MGKVLVAYFSATGTTGMVASRMANTIGADIYEIKPEIPYSNDDLNWRDANSRSSVEMKKEPNSRPAIGGDKVADMDQYDTIFLAAPIWWYRFPTIINTFLESYDLSGKKIVLFATSGSSGLGNSAEALKESAPGAEIIDGAMLNGKKSDDELRTIAEKFI